VKDGGCACVLLNTVKQAQAVVRQLKEIDCGGEHYLFHARFPAYRRCELEEQVVGLFGKEAVKKGKRPQRAVLVATQVVEQSLDLDFDVMISQLAPIDLLLQRCGRLWRHKEIGTPRYGLEEALHVLMPEMQNPKFGRSGYVYGEAALLRTIAVIEGCEQFSLPVDFRPLIDACYGDECVINSIISEREQTIADEERQRKKEIDAGKAVDILIPAPSSRVFSLAEIDHTKDESDESTTSYFSASTRLGRATCSVLMIEDPRLIEVVHCKKAPRRDVLKELFMHKVDIPAYWLKDTIATNGFEQFFEGEKWLRQTTIIPTISGRWQGIRDGKGFEIVCDPVMGVEMNEDLSE